MLRVVLLVLALLPPLVAVLPSITLGPYDGLLGLRPRDFDLAFGFAAAAPSAAAVAASAVGATVRCGLTARRRICAVDSEPPVEVTTATSSSAHACPRNQILVHVVYCFHGLQVVLRPPFKRATPLEKSRPSSFLLELLEERLQLLGHGFVPTP